MFGKNDLPECRAIAPLQIPCRMSRTKFKQQSMELPPPVTTIGSPQKIRCFKTFLNLSDPNSRHKTMTIGRFENPFAGQLCELHGHLQTTRVVVVRVSPAHKVLAIKLGLFGFDQVNRTASASTHASSARQLNLLPMPHQSGPAGRHSYHNQQTTWSPKSLLATRRDSFQNQSSTRTSRTQRPIGPQDR
jgi:hypothetical protein